MIEPRYAPHGMLAAIHVPPKKRVNDLLVLHRAEKPLDRAGQIFPLFRVRQFKKLRVPDAHFLLKRFARLAFHRYQAAG